MMNVLQLCVMCNRGKLRLTSSRRIKTGIGIEDDD